MTDRRLLHQARLGAATAALVLLALPRPVSGYVEVPITLADVIRQSTNIVLMQVTKVDRERNLIIYQKLQDIKGQHPQNEIKHNIGRGGLRPGEWEEIMRWAEVGKLAVFFHNGGASETYIGVTWYQAYPQGDWWGMSHGEPYLLRSYAGKVEKLPGYCRDILDGKEVIVPCMVDGDKEALHKKTARIQRMRTSLKNFDYNPKRDFVGWGGEDIRLLRGLPGFDRYAGLTQLPGEVQSVSVVDFDADGKPDICLCGAYKVTLFQNGGDGFVELSLPGYAGGARAAVWADGTGNGLPDLFLATPNGPRLFVNLGKGQFRDATHRLPREAAYNLTSAAWGDFDADGKPDLLVANGFYGLRLYRNARADAPKRVLPRAGDWYAIGMFRAPNPADNFSTAFPVESEKFDPGKEYKGKRDIPVRWAKKDYKDGERNDLSEFGFNCATYLYRELEMPAAGDVPVSISSAHNLAVWVNGERVYAEAAARAEPVGLTLRLKPGKNTLLLKMTNGDQPHAFTFSLGGDDGLGGLRFEDVSAAWGLGPTGPAAEVKGDSLAVADVTGDGRPDFLYGAGTGLLFVNHGDRFALRADSGIAYRPGKVGPVIGDFDGDGHPDLFVPQADGSCKLYRNDGQGRFSDVTARAGDLARPIPGAVAAAWGDFDNDGKPDLLVGCLRGTNRYFRNNGDGTFSDRTVELGLTQRVFNTRAVAWADLNADGRLDLVLANEGQESCVLFGTAPPGGPLTPLVVSLTGTPGWGGGRVVVRDRGGRAVATATITGGDGRGGQGGLIPRFLLPPGTYRLEWVGPGGRTPATKDVTVGPAPVSVRFD